MTRRGNAFLLALLVSLPLSACGEATDASSSTPSGAASLDAGRRSEVAPGAATGAATEEAVDPRLLALRTAAAGSNLLLVTVDTLRADHLGCYGASGSPTPVIDRLATGGVRFERCLAATPVTLPSHTTLMTGRHPFEHGVRDNGLFLAGDELETLAESLAAAGWNTAAFVSARVLAARYGLSQGFAHYDDDFGADAQGARVERGAEATVAAATRWLRDDAAGSSQPWFLWVHLFDPHAPYLPHDRVSPGADAAERYAAEVAHVDTELGRLLAVLDVLGESEDTLVTLTADHGESLGEHGELTHGLFVYDATQHVPWLLRGPGLPTDTVVQEQTAGVDLMPTLLDLLGVVAPAAVSGRSLSEAMLGLSEPSAAPPAYVETEASLHGFGLAPLAGLSSTAYKYIAAPRPELYDLRLDPDETEDRFASREQVAREMARALDKLRGPLGAPAAARRPDALPDDEREQLESLGYVFAGEAATLADPKDVVAQASALRGQLAEASARRELARVLELAAQLLELFPGDASAMAARGRALIGLERFDEAVAILETATHLRPDRAGPFVDLAWARRLGGDGPGALVAYELAIAADPFELRALMEGAQLALDLGDPAASLSFAERALATGLLDAEVAAGVRGMVQQLEEALD